MTKLGVVVLCSFSFMSWSGCGGGDDDGNGDGGGKKSDAMPFPIDGGDLLLPPDAMRTPDATVVRGDVEDFAECSTDNNCMNPKSHCRAISYYNPPQKQCVPECAAGGTADCPFNTVCYRNPMSASFIFIKDHCWYSICGEGVQNGTTNGACTMGVDRFAGIDNPQADRLPGYCLSLEDSFFGQCLEAGNVAVGGECDYGTQTRDGKNCDSTGLCVGSSMSPTGTCAKTCDPALILQGNPQAGCPAEQQCQDQSRVITYYDGGTMTTSYARSSIAFCNSVTACGLIGALNNCPAAMGGGAQGCLPTSSLRPTGICDPKGVGSVMAGAACTGMDGDANECVAGNICAGTCQTVCKRPPATCSMQDDCQPSEMCTNNKCQLAYETGPDVDCTTVNAAFTCKGVRWDGGFDEMNGNGDDNFTHDWGTCQM